MYSVRPVRTRLVRGRWMTIAGSLQAMSVNGENGHDGDLSPCVYGMAMTERVLQGLIKRSCAVLRGLLVVGQGAARRQGWYDPSSWLHGLGLLLSGIPEESWEERVSPRTANALLCTVSQPSPASSLSLLFSQWNMHINTTQSTDRWDT